VSENQTLKRNNHWTKKSCYCSLCMQSG